MSLQSIQLGGYPKPMARNLLRNPCGDDQLKFWDLSKNGGNRWKVETVPGDEGHFLFGTKHYFVTSHNLCLKKQVINLLAEGYRADELDKQPIVIIQDWYSGRTDCGCTYQLIVRLLDRHHKVLAEFRIAKATLETDDSDWRKVIHLFTNYGKGLRFVSFEHGGQDTRFWEGWFGVRVTDSAVIIR